MISRFEYLKGRASHKEYYGQFIDQDIRDTVAMFFGVNNLLAAYSNNVHFNTIPLWKWDGLCLSPFLWDDEFRRLAREADEQFSLSFRVNVLKEAARQIVKEGRYGTVQMVTRESSSMVLLRGVRASHRPGAGGKRLAVPVRQGQPGQEQPR